MTVVRTGDLLAAAVRDGVGVGAFNVVTLEHAEAIVAGAEQAGAAAILQISENTVRFHHGRLLPLATAAASVAETAAVDVSLHLDHVEDIGLLQQALGAGLSSAMFDASKLDYAANVAATRDAAAWAHDNGLFLEAELGEVGGKDGAHAPGVRTDPAQAADYVAATGVDALAVAVGTSHAMTERTAVVDAELIAALRAAVPVPLVLHGSSGLSDSQLAVAVAAGMVKVNIATILNVAFTTTVRDRLRDHAVVDPRRYLAPGREAISEVVAHLLAVLTGE